MPSTPAPLVPEPFVRPRFVPEPFVMADPATSTPPRRPGSVRRTTTHDSTRPEGLSGPVHLFARGRDLRTDADGLAHVVDDAQVAFEIEFATGKVLAADATPADPRLGALTDASVYLKFRAAVEAAMPGEGSSGAVRAQLLDDVPIALMLSGRVYRAAGVPIEMSSKDRPPQNDICAGWITDGAAIHGLEQDGTPPLTVGPEAPAVEAGDDPDAWHPIRPLPPHSTRRRRRLDVWEDDGVVHVDCFFRDSHFDDRSMETVVHEWRVVATLDPDTLEFTNCDAERGPLPFGECPAATASAGRLVGASPAGLRREVRSTFVGPSTCTHLNDTLRSFEDVGALLAVVRGEAAG